MRYNHIPGSSATIPGLPTALRTMPEPTSTRKITPLLLLVLCILLSHGAVLSYSYGADVILVGSDARSAVLELQVGDLAFESKELGGKNYHSISYDNSAFTSETGKPQLPVSHAFIGVPPAASISVRIVDSQYTDLRGYIPLPVPERVQHTSSDGVDTLVGNFVEDREFYRRNTFYPSENAALVYEGYVRRQRVAVIELRPVQYNPATRLLRKYSRLVVEVNFSPGPGAPLIPNVSESMSTGYQPSRTDKYFEESYQSLLLNYDDARKWRRSGSVTASASPAPRSETSAEALKIFVRESGIYRLDSSMLLGAGMDLSGIDPRTIKVQLHGSQVPIYIHGEADGRFDDGDYVEFFGARAHNIYTRWDVYRLSWGGVRGMRVAQKSGASKAFAAREVTSFNSVVRFEEDHLHHKLQNVSPDPKDPEAWFESRDHWFWDGIKNGSSKAEMTVEFPVYDLAQSLIRPNLKYELVGCTNFDHHAIVTVNGYKAGEEAQWDRQDIFSFDGQISSNAFQEGINKLRLTRIGTNRADGESTDSYPYQIYLNWFEIGYVRKLLAVNDSLVFSAPEPKEPDAEEINRFTISSLFNSDVEIFQITDSNAVARFKNVVVRKYSLDQEGRDRIKSINSMSDEAIMPNSQNFAYRASFEDQGGGSARYIAVTPASVLTPERIELDAPSNLKDISNQADYIIISHPIFMDTASKLADWRRSARGGGFRVELVDVTDVYDEFGFGMVSPKAIKDFLTFAYNNWTEPSPAYVLIFADATFDFLGINKDFYAEAPELIGFVPSFYIHTTFGQTAVDHWYSTIDGDDGFPDIYLGRIPVEDVYEAETVVGKIIANESGSVNGPWRKQIIAVADDDSYAAGDEQFRAGLEEIWRSYTPPGYDTEKIYLKDIIQEIEQNELDTRRPAQVMKGRILDAFGNGSVVAQYSGHGGRHVWAHEIVFSIVDIEKTRDMEVYPFMLVLSCYNGYFDLPGELSMAEGLLRANGRGIVAMLSATRLTYGSGNIALNKLLFEGIFQEKLLRVGQVTAISKTKLLIDEGLNWLNQMQQYTLFGDPASRLNLADYETYPELDNATAAPGGKLKVRAGQAVKSIGGQPGNFSGQLTARVSFPDGTETSKTAAVANGSYPAMSFDIPAGMIGGQGRLTLFGENASEIMIGGAKFTISEPSILNVRHEFIADGVQFYAEVSDDAGISGIKSVVLTWRSHSNWVESDLPMIFDQGKSVHRLDKAVTLPSGNSSFSYYVTVEDIEGNSISTERQTVSPSSKPDLSVLVVFTEPAISYGYSSQHQASGVNVRIQNDENAEVTGPVDVFAFEGDPDQNNDKIVDNDARVLGKGKIAPGEWDDSGVVSVFIPLALAAGRHVVSVWVDPELGAGNPDGVFGAYDEINENNNLSYEILDITQILLKPAQKGQTHSFDGVLHFSAPAGAVGRAEAIAIEPVQDFQQPVNQPSVSVVPLPEGQQGGYRVLPLHNSEIEDLEFQKPALLEMSFDLGSFKDDVKEEIGLADIPTDELIPEQIEALERMLKERIAGIAIHRWYENAQKWANIPSTPVLDTDGNILSRIHNSIPATQNTGTGNIQTSNTQTDPDATPVGEWVIFFIDSDRYQLYFRDSSGNAQLRTLSNKIGYAGQLYNDDAATGGGTEIQFTVAQGDTPFQFGDVLRFITIESVSQGTRTVLVSNVRQGRESDGIVRNISIDEGSDPPVDEWAILFLDPEHFHLQGEETGVIEKNNEPYIGTLGEEFHDQTTGFRFTIMPGAEVLKAGHRFRFKTMEVGTIQAALELTGTFNLMLNRDTRPPEVQMDIAHQNFADGDVVSSEPTIHALISDDNGVDVLMRGLSILISRGGRDFEPVGEDDYVFQWDAASNDVPVNYWPGKLESGEYEVKLEAYDFNGNSNTGSIKFVVKGDFKLANNSLMNYPNPFERETDITFQLSSLADEAIVKVYTVSGRRIRTLEERHAVNFVVIHWDGRDEDGKEVANGVYYYKVRLKSEGREDIVEIGKMMKLK